MLTQKFIIIFQHGPVQEFISTARKTDDLWSGSDLLGQVTVRVITELEDNLKAEILYPYLDSLDGKGEVGGLPNRIAAIVETSDGDSALREKLSHIKDRVFEFLVGHHEQIVNCLPLSSRETPSSEQVKATFESYFVFSPYCDHDHAGSFKKAEDLMAARRAIRDFVHGGEELEPGNRFCTLCGVRSAVQIDEKGVRQLRYTFKERERLCSICTAKRIYKKIGQEVLERRPCPSINTICVSAWLSQIKDCFDEHKLKNFKAKVYEMGKSACVPKADSQIHSFAKPPNLGRDLLTYVGDSPLKEDRSWVFNIEGSYWIPDAYVRLKKEAKGEDKKIVSCAEKYLLQLLERLPEYLRQPPKYYSIVRFDADDMGAHLMDCESKDHHQELSKHLFEFGRALREVCHEEHYAYLVYFGGDEGIVLCPLMEVMGLIKGIRDSFLEHMNKNQSDKQKPITLSLGVCFLHHQSPLSEGVRMAKSALDRAKALEGKDGVGFTISLRSSHTSSCAVRWNYQSFSFDQFVTAWLDAYTSPEYSLSPRWWYRFCENQLKVRTEDSTGKVSPVNPLLVRNLLHRTVPRHLRNPDKARELIEKTMELTYENRLSQFDDLAAVLQVPLFLYRQ